MLSISSGAKAYVSGCAKGGITLSGGGVADNATLNTEGTFKLMSSSAPVNLTVGAKSIDIQQSGGSYVSIQAGAFRANVLSGGSTIGTALVGGTKNTDNTITSYNSVYGGDINFITGTVGTFWGNTMALGGFSATYNTLKANSDVSILTANVGKFQGGGNLSVTQWNTPTFSTASQIAGKVLNQDGTPYTGNTIANLTPNVAGASPGLPGVPYCNVSATRPTTCSRSPGTRRC